MGGQGFDFFPWQYCMHFTFSQYCSSVLFTTWVWVLCGRNSSFTSLGLQGKRFFMSSVNYRNQCTSIHICIFDNLLNRSACHLFIKKNKKKNHILLIYLCIQGLLSSSLLGFANSRLLLTTCMDSSTTFLFSVRKMQTPKE